MGGAFTISHVVTNQMNPATIMHSQHTVRDRQKNKLHVYLDHNKPATSLTAMFGKAQIQNNFNGDKKIYTGTKSSSVAPDITMIEKEIIANTQAKIDFKRVTDAILEETSNNDDDTRLILDSNKNKGQNHDIALTAASISTLILFLVWHNYIISVVVFALVYFVALGDPIEEDNVIGALTRILGRSALSITSSIKPRMQSILRASLKGDDELLELRNQVQMLQEENKSLQALLFKKEAIENELPKYTLDQLKELCRNHNVSGFSGLTKEKLFSKLVDGGIIKL